MSFSFHPTAQDVVDPKVYVTNESGLDIYLEYFSYMPLFEHIRNSGQTVPKGATKLLLDKGIFFLAQPGSTGSIRNQQNTITVLVYDGNLADSKLITSRSQQVVGFSEAESIKDHKLHLYIAVTDNLNVTIEVKQVCE